MANAFDKKNIRSIMGWSNGFDPDGAFPLDVSCWFGSLADAQAAAKTAVEFGSTESKYHFGKQLYVFDGTQCKTYLIQGDKTLKEIGGSQMAFAEDEAEMLAMVKIEAGQQVFRADTKTTWIFKGGDISNIDNWVEANPETQAVWEGTENQVLFYALTNAQYKALDSKSENTLYFITDAKRICKGSSDITACVAVVDSTLHPADAVAGMLYVNKTDFTCQITIDNENWIVTSPGYLTDGAEWAKADSGKFATIGLIKKGIEEAITDAKVGVAHDPTYDASTLTITIPVIGKDDLVIQIPKDKFVTSGKYYKDYPEDNPTEHNVIVFILENQEEPVIVPAQALVDIYVADNGDNDIIVTVTDDNKISAVAKIDPIANNALVTSKDGLKVDISGKVDRINGALGNQIVLSQADGSVIESGLSLLTQGNMGNSATEIPTAKLIADAIAAAVKLSADTKIDKLTDAVETNVVIFGADGAVKDSGKAIGGAELAAIPDANTLATEAAVRKAVDDATLVWTIL